MCGDDGGGGGDQDEGGQPGFGHQTEEGIVDGGGIGQDQRALTEVVQDERGHHQCDPGGDDGFAPEMAQIGIERLGPRDGEEDRAEDEEGDRLVFHQEAHRVAG